MGSQISGMFRPTAHNEPVIEHKGGPVGQGKVTQRSHWTANESPQQLQTRIQTQLNNIVSDTKKEVKYRQAGGRTATIEQPDYRLQWQLPVNEECSAYAQMVRSHSNKRLVLHYSDGKQVREIKISSDPELFEEIKEYILNHANPVDLPTGVTKDKIQNDFNEFARLENVARNLSKTGLTGWPGFN